MTIEKDKWRKEIQEFKTSLNIAPTALPRESAYEFQHALNHILTGYKRTLAARHVEIDKALGHIRRSHLDFLKILLFQVYKCLTQNADSTHELSKFKKRMIKARLEELNSIGTDHMNSVNGFREILYTYKSILPRDPAHLYPLAEDAALRASTIHNNFLLTEKERELLWEWAQLEVVLTSLSGQKIYDVVFNMVQTYLTSESFEEDIIFQIASLKALLVNLACQMDADGSLKESLGAVESWHLLVKPAIDRLSEAQIDEAAYTIKDNIDEIFPKVVSFLDIHLTNLHSGLNRHGTC